MDRDILTHLPVFLAVARNNSFANAAAELNMSPSAVSHAIKLIESRLGLLLFARTTRSVTLTEAGQIFQNTAMNAFASLEETIDQLHLSAEKVSGQLRLSVPRTALSLVITPVVVELSKRHPNLVVEVASEDATIDIVANGYDAGIRLREMVAKDMIAVRLTPPFKMITVASPAYIRSRGEPKKLADLSLHNCIGFRLVGSGRIYDWELSSGRKTVAITVSGSVIVTDATYAKELALNDIGIAYLMEPMVRKELKEGHLHQVLGGNALREPGLFLYYPQRASTMPKLRAFVELAQEILRSMSN